MRVAVRLAGVQWGDAPPQIHADNKITDRLAVTAVSPVEYPGTVDVELAVLDDGQLGDDPTNGQVLAYAVDAAGEIPELDKVNGIEISIERRTCPSRVMHNPAI